MSHQHELDREASNLLLDEHRDLYSGFLIARLKIAGNDPKLRDRALQQLQEAASRSAASFVPCRWLIESVPPESVDALEAVLPSEERPQLSRVARVDLRENPAYLAATLTSLRANVELIDFAYAELAVTFESGSTHASATAKTQLYLDGAPEGINARSSWSQVDLSRCRLIDIESAWSLAHEDIDYGKVKLLNSMISSCKRCVNHGTSVLGVVVAKLGAPGGTGVAYAVRAIELVSTWNPANQTDLNVADAILAAVNQWTAGGDANVILLEVQRGSPFKPTEVEWVDWKAIKIAIAHGMVVIESAGNGKTQIDRLPPSISLPPNQILRVQSGGVEIMDSGAVMVGAGRHELRNNCHQRYPTSNFGTRIDCYAWGDSIYTTGQEMLGPNLDKSYREEFGGTSGAAAIVAGAALLMQGRRLKLSKTFLTPPDLRDLLKNYGTCQLNPANDPVGTMPDLKKIFTKL